MCSFASPVRRKIRALSGKHLLVALKHSRRISSQRSAAQAEELDARIQNESRTSISSALHSVLSQKIDVGKSNRADTWCAIDRLERVASRGIIVNPSLSMLFFAGNPAWTLGGSDVCGEQQTARPVGCDVQIRVTASVVLASSGVPRDSIMLGPRQ